MASLVCPIPKYKIGRGKGPGQLGKEAGGTGKPEVWVHFRSLLRAQTFPLP